MQNKSSDLTEGPLLSRIIFYTVPIIMTGILQLLFNAADLVVIGQFRGSVSVGAIGLTAPVINLLVNLFIGFSVGAGVAVAHGIGAGKDEDVRRVVHTAIPLAALCGIVLTAVGITQAENILRLMDTPPESLNLSATYMKIYFAGITASMLYNFGSAILRAAGDTKSPLYYLTAAGILNVILNLFFVVIMGMNVGGVALATTISQALSAILIIRALMKRNDACRLKLRELHIYKRQLIRIIQIGFPAGIQGSLFSISNVIIQSSVNFFGQIAVSGNSAAANIEGFVYTSMNSVHQTAVNFAGQNHGARNFDRIRKTAFTSLGLVAFIGLTLGSAAYFFARPLLSIYIKDSEEAIGYGITRIMYICLPYCLCGLMDVTTGLLRGIGSSIAPMIITVAGVCGFRIVWIYTIFTIPKYHTLPVLLISYAISWVVTFLIEIVFFFVKLRMDEKKYLAAKT